MATATIIGENLKTDRPNVAPGDSIAVTQKIKEGGKDRLTKFEGLVIAVKHGRGISATFTVRKVVDGIGVERIFPLHSPVITKIDILRRSKVRRAKLYYIREKAAREVRKKMKKIWAEDTTPEQESITPNTTVQAETTEHTPTE